MHIKDQDGGTTIYWLLDEHPWTGNAVPTRRPRKDGGRPRLSDTTTLEPGLLEWLDHNAPGWTGDIEWDWVYPPSGPRHKDSWVTFRLPDGDIAKRLGERVKAETDRRDQMIAAITGRPTRELMADGGARGVTGITWDGASDIQMANGVVLKAKKLDWILQHIGEWDPDKRRYRGVGVVDGVQPGPTSRDVRIMLRGDDVEVVIVDLQFGYMRYPMIVMDASERDMETGPKTIGDRIRLHREQMLTMDNPKLNEPHSTAIHRFLNSVAKVDEGLEPLWFRLQSSRDRRGRAYDDLEYDWIVSRPIPGTLLERAKGKPERVLIAGTTRSGDIAAQRFDLPEGNARG